MGKNPSNPFDNKLQNMETVSYVWNFINNHSKTDLDKVFIMSDAECVMEAARNQSFAHRLINSPGPILHVDLFQRRGSKEQKCLGLEKLLLDQHLLSQCHVLVVGSSGISRMAAYLRGTDLDLFCYLKDGVKPCTRDEFDKHYNGSVRDIDC